MHASICMKQIPNGRLSRILYFCNYMCHTKYALFLRNYARNMETTVIWWIALLLWLSSKCRTTAVHQIKKPKWIAWLLSLLAEIKVLIFWSSSSSLIIYDIFIKIKIWIEQIKTFWQCATDTQSDQPFLS